MTNHELLERLLALVSDERRITLDVLQCLGEVEARQLHLEMGYSSLFDFATRHLKFSEGAAMRRIKSMRLIRSRPEVEAKIASGDLSLTVAASAQSFIARNDIPAEHVLAQVEGKSAREAEREYFKMAPQALPDERVRPVSETHTEIRLIVDAETKARLDELLALNAHKFKTYGELIKSLAVVKRSPPAPGVESDTRHVPVGLKAAVWERDRGSCQYRDPKSGRRCRSKHFLQIDHVLPWALGGTTTMSNLRLLCRSHNQFLAARMFNRPYPEP